MKRFLTELCLITLCLLGLNLKAQTSIGFDSSYVVNFTTSVHQNDTASFNVRIKNYGPIQADCVFVYSGYKNSQGVISGIQQEFLYPAGIISSIPSSGLITKRLIINYSATRFPVGIDVVVIWPKAANATTADTLEFMPLVLPPLSVAQVLRDEGLVVFPNPFSNSINIHSKRQIESITIYDFDGKIVYFRAAEETIDLSQIAVASYILEIKYNSGTRKRIQVVKRSNDK
ncbi:MAG: T9SS type A sorting domain-containing protein [Bacteroidetes bacterium]|nr:T9SS type A sorting domain-containing protein [Bacteroidota bacterium]